MKVIIKNENGIEEVLYEPDPIQEKPSIIGYIMLVFVVGLPIFIVGAGIFEILKFILNDTTMAIIAVLIIISFGSFCVYNYSSSVSFMFINKTTQSIVIDYEFMNKEKSKREILKFLDIKDIRIVDIDTDYGSFVTNLNLVKKDNKNINLNVPFGKGIEIARSIGIDCRYIAWGKSSLLYKA